METFGRKNSGREIRLLIAASLQSFIKNALHGNTSVAVSCRCVVYMYDALEKAKEQTEGNLRTVPVPPFYWLLLVLPEKVKR